jgi:hypothetical protein
MAAQCASPLPDSAAGRAPAGGEPCSPRAVAAAAAAAAALGAVGDGASSEWQTTLASVCKAVVVLKVRPAARAQRSTRRVANKSALPPQTTATKAFDTETAGSSYATGFVVDAARGIILTNRHVVKPGPVIAEVRAALHCSAHAAASGACAAPPHASYRLRRGGGDAACCARARLPCACACEALSASALLQAVFLNREEIPVRALYRDPIHDFGFFVFDPTLLQFMQARRKALCCALRGAAQARPARIGAG